MMFLKMAWRNIWRNPKRSMVILTAIVIGIFAMITGAALMRGFEEGMVENSLKTLIGDVQIHNPKYLDDPVVENSMIDASRLESVLAHTLPATTFWATRVRVNAIVSNARHSSGIVVVGIDPDKEARVSFIGDAVVDGRYLGKGDENAILVGKAFLDQFDTGINKKLVITTQSLDHDITARAFRIRGVYDAEMANTEKQFVFITKASAQDMLKIKDAVSEAVVVTGDKMTPENAAQMLRHKLDTKNYDVRTWRELKPILVAYIKLLDGFTYVWNIVLFIAMGFGIVNTTLMAVFERIREFGLFKSLGMKPRWILRQVITESFFLLIVGAIVGNAFAFLAALGLSGGIDLSAFAQGMEYVGFSRVIYPHIYVKDLISANLTVFILGLLVSLYPAAKAARLTPVEALAHF